LKPIAASFVAKTPSILLGENPSEETAIQTLLSDTLRLLPFNVFLQSSESNSALLYLIPERRSPHPPRFRFVPITRQDGPYGVVNRLALSWLGLLVSQKNRPTSRWANSALVLAPSELELQQVA